MNPRIYLHDERTGDPIRQLPIEWWLRFEASTHVNKVSRAQGAFSPCMNPQMVRLYETRKGFALHDITTVWSIPIPRAYAFASNRELKYQIWDQYLTVYNKQEWQEDTWRYREFQIGHDPKVLMDMSVIAGDETNPDGTFLGVLGGATWEQMIAISNNALANKPICNSQVFVLVGTNLNSTGESTKPLANNPQVATAITSVVYTGAGVGLPAHPISYNCDNWLDAMIDLEAASYYAWARGLVDSPVEFRLVPTSTNTWELQIGLFARDKRFKEDGSATDPTVLSLRRGNIISGESVNDHSKSITEAFVIGRGVGSAKELERVTDPVRSAYSKFNLRQQCVRGHKAPTGSTGVGNELNTIGDSFFREQGEADSIVVREYQRGGARLLIDIIKFDWITVSLNNQFQDVRVVGYNVVWEAGKPPRYSLDVELLDGRQQRGKGSFEMAIKKLDELEEWQDYVATEIA